MSTNFNNTVPSAPSGGTNVLWQNDGSGNVSAYVPTGAAEQIKVDATAQSADIAPTTLFAVTAAGRFRVSGYIIVTQVGSVSSTLGSIVITWTDADNSASQSLTLTPTNSGNLLTTYQEATGIISAEVSTNISYSTSGYAASSAASMQFALHLVLESL